jgi:rhamnogalacturonyl hydrolase YesR
LELYDKLVQLKSQNYSGLCWGYNFDWQARAFNVPKFKPNMVCSVFGGHALLDLFDHTSHEIYLSQARQVAQFIMENLVLIDESNKMCFGYIPGEPAVIHNVNLLGAAFLARLAHITSDQALAAHALKAVSFSVENQRSDGAWVYGDQSHHQWVDNFHTGYILVAIHQYQKFCHDDRFQKNLIKGIEFHLKNHFTENMLPKYSDRKLYPLDIHCFAQALITFHTLQSCIPDYQMRIVKTLSNVTDLLWDREHHYFYYKKSRFFKSKIPYVRWAQAWMFYSLTLLLETINE